MLSPSEFLIYWQSQPSETIEPELKELLNARLEQTDGHLEWAQTAEELGCSTLAFREAQLAVRDQPDSPLALLLLAQMLMERGNALRATVHLEHLLQIQADHVQAKELLTEIYTHLGQIDVLKGRKVKQKETIGTVGVSGSF